MIYQGGAWPEEYRGQMFMGNIHGHRINMDRLKPKGSSFVASHGPDFLLANDSWARFINMRYGPDGNVYLLDWYDKQACHVGDKVDAWDRDNGRIYKISYRGTKPVVGLDLTKKSDKELVELLENKNEWYVRHARRLLQERAANKKLDKDTHELLAKLVFGDKPETVRLRALWALHAIGGLTEGLVRKGLADKTDYIRAWTVQFAAEGGMSAITPFKGDLLRLENKETSTVVRSYMASAAQRCPELVDYFMLLEEYQLTRKEDTNDPNLPLLYWYAVEARLAQLDNEKTPGAVRRHALSYLISESPIGLVREFSVRRIASMHDSAALYVLMRELRTTPDQNQHKLILRNTLLGLKGKGHVEMPEKWEETVEKYRWFVSDNLELQSLAYSLAVVFGDPKALAHMRQLLASTNTDLPSRQAALMALLDVRDKDLPPVLHQLVGEPALRGAAIRALASYDDPKTPGVVLDVFASLNGQEKRDALNTLAARPSYGKALMDAIAAKKVPATDVPAEIVRNLRNLKDKDLDARIAEVWGIVRTTPADRAKLIREWRQKVNLTGPPPDLALGRAVFAKTCQQCHTLYGVGGKVGPDITGSNRPNLDYLLENILDPSAVIPNDYKATVIELKNGRTITGIVRGETPTALTVLTANETLTVPVKEVDTRKVSDVSMMPDDLLKPLNDTEVRALVAYLRNPTQTQILATTDNAKDFFNGKDLTGWDGDPKLWSVQDGEIVGKSPEDFKLTLKLKLVPNKENSGVQFRSEPLPDGEMKGPQADVGLGWWGKLYEESGRGVLSDNKATEKVVKVDDWNEYVIIAEGSRVKTYLNGELCVDVDDPKISRRGIFGLQIHSGGPMEVRFKDIKLEVLPRK
jgi:putative heme-binding domain-containing protein